MNTVLMFALVLVLLALTAFFDLAEKALAAAHASALHGVQNGKAAGKVLDLKNRPGLFLTAMRAGDLINDLFTGAFIVSWIETLIRTRLGALPVVGRYASAVAGLGASAGFSSSTFQK
jgi:putative hemolysin